MEQLLQPTFSSGLITALQMKFKHMIRNCCVVIILISIVFFIFSYLACDLKRELCVLSGGCHRPLCCLSRHKHMLHVLRHVFLHNQRIISLRVVT